MTVLGPAGPAPSPSRARRLRRRLRGSSRSKADFTRFGGSGKGGPSVASWPRSATSHEAVYYLLDCAPTLHSFVADVEAGPAFVRRTDSEQTGQVLDSYRCGCAARESADAAGEAVPSTGTPTTRWRFSSLMSARRPRPPLVRIPDITPVSPTRTASASRADPARRARTGVILTAGCVSDGKQAAKRNDDVEIASRAFDVVVAGLVLLVV